MIQLKGDYTDLIRFIPAGKEESVTRSKNSTKDPASNLSGAEAKDFYESLLKDEKEEKTAYTKSPKQRRKRKSTHDDNNEGIRLKKEDSFGLHKRRPDLERKFNTHEFLKFAQHGKLKEMKKLLERGIPVNVCDGYGWTAVMCAAYEGHCDIVDCLLKHGADVDLCDGHNKTAYSLASERGHKSILELINRYKRRRSTRSENKSHSDPLNSFFCDICKSEFNNCTKKEHETSTVHLFNLKLKPKPDKFLIPSTNVGYRIMKKKGWDGEKGLGVSGKGQKYPVKTKLKRDRKCLGNETDQKVKARITHFGPCDSSSVKSNAKTTTDRKLSARTLSKKAKLANDRKMKRWEQNLRLYFNSE